MPVRLCLCSPIADFLPVRFGRGFEPLWEPFAEVTGFVIDSSLGRWGSAMNCILLRSKIQALLTSSQVRLCGGQSGQDLVVQQGVGRYRAAAVRAGAPIEAGER